MSRQSGSSFVEALLLVGLVALFLVAGSAMFGRTLTSRVCSAASQLATAGLKDPPHSKLPPASTFGGGTCSTTNSKGGGTTDVAVPSPDSSLAAEEM